MDLENVFWLVSSKSRLNLHNPGDKLFNCHSSSALSLLSLTRCLCCEKEKKVMAAAGLNLTPALSSPAGCCQ